jgi:hypothetical protein
MEKSNGAIETENWQKILIIFCSQAIFAVEY